MRLRTRYILSIGGLLAVVAGFIVGLHMMDMRNVFAATSRIYGEMMTTTLFSQVRKEGVELSRFLASVIVDPIHRREIDRIHDIGRSVEKRHGVLCIAVFDARKQVLFETTGPTKGAGPGADSAIVREALRSGTPATLTEGNVLYIVAPVMQGRLPVGWLKLGLSLAELNADIDIVRGIVTEVVETNHRRLVYLYISVAVAMVLVGLLISLFMARSLVRPIRALGEYTRRIGAGNYDDAPPFERSDELGDLARSLAQMSRDLKQVSQVSRLATLGEMAVGMAHELSQPLNTIRLAAENTLMLMEQGKTDTAFEKGKLELISQQADSMGDLIRRMCVVGRNETLRDVINPCESVLDAQALLSGQFESEGITIAVDMPQKCTAVLGMRNELAQVLINLLTNARDAIVESAAGRKGRFAPLGGRIEIAVEDASAGGAASGAEVLIKVKDNGGGVPPEIIDRIFDPFFSTKDVGKGTGLGLSISYGLVKEMGGSLSVENFGGGALFTIRLPVARDNGCTI